MDELTLLCEGCYNPVVDDEPRVTEQVTDPCTGVELARYWHMDHAPARFRGAP